MKAEDLKIGVYRTTRDVAAIRPDKRRRGDWRAAPVKAGTLIYSVLSYYHDLLGENQKVITVYAGAWAHMDLRPEQCADLIDAMELETDTPSRWLHREHGTRYADDLLDVLVSSGKITLDDVKAAHAAFFERE